MTSTAAMRPGGDDGLASVQRAAESFVDSTRRASEGRERELELVAQLLAQIDEPAAERLRQSARAATGDAVRRAEEQAGEVRHAAANRVLRMVTRYAGTLLGEARIANQARAERQGALIAGVGRVDGRAAKAMERAIAEADAARLTSAAHQAEELARSAEAAMRGQAQGG